MQDFIDFMREKGVIGLAVGFLMGGAISKLVGAFVEDLVNPLVGLLLGKLGDLGAASSVIGAATLKWGDFVSTFIDFAVIAFIIYFVFRWLGLEKLDKKAESAK